MNLLLKQICSACKTLALAAPLLMQFVFYLVVGVMPSIQDDIIYHQENYSLLDLFKKMHSLINTIFKLTVSEDMINPETDLDGFTESTRRRMVDTAVSRLRMTGIEPRVSLLLLYEQYVIGEIDRGELQIRMQNRLANHIAHMSNYPLGIKKSEITNSYEQES